MSEKEETETLAKGKKRQSPQEIAAKLMDRVRFITDHSDTSFRYTGAYWQLLSKTTMRQVALEADGFRRSTVSRRNEIIDQIKARSHKPELEWGRVKDNEIPFLDGVLDVKTRKLRPHNPEDFLERVPPWKWEPSAKCPVWLQTLDDWFGTVSDESGLSAGGEREALQEFFGYALASHAKYKTALFVFGESDTGKSLITYILSLMVGRDRCCTLPLEHMNDPQARGVIVGKAINLITEIDSQALIADGGFKAMISTEEPVLINEKYKAPFAYWPTAKHVFLTNNMPRLSDRTEAVLNRLLIVHLTRVFSRKEQDDTLTEKLATEIPGILAWATDGAARLIKQRGKFTQPASAGAELNQLRRQANPAIDFVKECLEQYPGGAVPLRRLTDLFNRWHAGGRRITTRTLAANLRKAGHTVKEIRYSRNPDRVATSLTGFRIMADQDIPLLFSVDPAAAASLEQEIGGDVAAKSSATGASPPDDGAPPNDGDGR